MTRRYTLVPSTKRYTLVPSTKRLRIFRTIETPAVQPYSQNQEYFNYLFLEIKFKAKYWLQILVGVIIKFNRKLHR